MEFFDSSSPASTFVNMRYCVYAAMQHLQCLQTVKDPEAVAFHTRKVAELEQVFQSLETDFTVGGMPTDVTFDTPPNEWWYDTDWPTPAAN